MTTFIPMSPTSIAAMNTCPRQFQAKYITKEVTFQETPAIIWGNRAHKAMENGIKDGTPVPSEFKFLQPVIDTITEFGGTVLSETKLSIDRDGKPCNWFDRYLGGIADVVTMKGNHAFIGDLKTGKFKRDNLQLSILTKCLYATYPEISSVAAALFFPHTGQVHTLRSKRDTVSYEELDADIRHYEAVLERGEFKPKPSGLCKGWCDVISCKHNSKYNKPF